LNFGGLKKRGNFNFDKSMELFLINLIDFMTNLAFYYKNNDNLLLYIQYSRAAYENGLILFRYKEKSVRS
jgi:hypothetical protein